MDVPEIYPIIVECEGEALSLIHISLHGGVTSMISAGECHVPGRPKDPAGTKALAVLAHKSFANLKPSGVKVHGGGLILEKGLVEKDFEELKEQGVWIVGEIGLGSVKKPEDAAQMCIRDSCNTPWSR